MPDVPDVSGGPGHRRVAAALFLGGLIGIVAMVAVLATTGPDLRESARDEITEVVRLPFLADLVVDGLEERGVFEEAEQEVARTVRGAVLWAVGVVAVAALALGSLGRTRR